MRWNGIVFFVAVGVTAWGLSDARCADVFDMPEGYTSLEWVSVGNPDNLGELSGEGAGGYGYGPDRICGGVDYTYKISKYAVTAGQYVQFLNAVADIDTYGLYNTDMWLDDRPSCKIQRIGSVGSYTYAVAPDWANRPVNYVSWGDAARFVNWLHNGQPAGWQDLSTTEDGAYYLNGAANNASLMAVTREADWTWAITSEDEWYKAAYHKNDGQTGHYWDYPTSSDARPSDDLIDPDPGNNATFSWTGYTIGSPYYRTEVGAHENSASPYGTFDQGGNVWELNETIVSESHRGLRGGAWESDDFQLLAVRRAYAYAGGESSNIGFRVSSVPELPGDLNGDGFVGQTDLDAVLVDWGLSPPRLPFSDPSGDDFVGQADLDIVLADWGNVHPYSTANLVPEPATLSLLTLGGLALLRRKRK